MSKLTVYRCDGCQEATQNWIIHHWHVLTVTNELTEIVRDVHICPTCWPTMTFVQVLK